MRDERTWAASRLWDLGGLELRVRRTGREISKSLEGVMGAEKPWRRGRRRLKLDTTGSSWFLRDTSLISCEDRGELRVEEINEKFEH